MDRFFKVALVLVAVVAAAEALSCRQCPVGIFGACLFGSDTTCNNATESCFSGEASFNKTNAVKLQTKGCLDSDLCGKTLSGTLLSFAYSSSFTCCKTDMCNGATSAQLSVMAGVCAAVLSGLF